MGDLLNLLPNVSSWKLGEDVALLEAMQGLATSMGTTSKQLQERIDRLARETERAHTRLLTTQNNFVHLSNVKFIEARVYEDSEEAVGLIKKVGFQDHCQSKSESCLNYLYSVSDESSII